MMTANKKTLNQKTRAVELDRRCESTTVLSQCQAYQIMLYLLTNHEVCSQVDFSAAVN